MLLITIAIGTGIVVLYYYTHSYESYFYFLSRFVCFFVVVMVVGGGAENVVLFHLFVVKAKHANSLTPYLQLSPTVDSKEIKQAQFIQ